MTLNREIFPGFSGPSVITRVLKMREGRRRREAEGYVTGEEWSKDMERCWL